MTNKISGNLSTTAMDVMPHTEVARAPEMALVAGRALLAAAAQL